MLVDFNDKLFTESHKLLSEIELSGAYNSKTFQLIEQLLQIIESLEEVNLEHQNGW